MCCALPEITCSTYSTFTSSINTLAVTRVAVDIIVVQHHWRDIHNIMLQSHQWQHVSKHNLKSTSKGLQT